ncbi:MAG: sulfatase [Singulisphaera sp.]
MALWFGAVTGLLELALVLLHKRIFNTLTLETLRRNRHFVWMIPASNLLIFASLGLLIALAARLRPRQTSRLAFYPLGFGASLALLLLIPRLDPLAYILLAGGVTCWAARRFEPLAPGFRRVVRRSLPVLLIAVGTLIGLDYRHVASAERRALASLPAAQPGSPNVLVIVLDTVRADHLSPYGYHRDTSPNLARLAARGVRFEQARSTAPWTLPSHASMFTGRWPHELSARTGHPLDATYPTLAEILSRKGYAAASFVANTHNCNAWYGLDRGFARYEDFYRNTEVSTIEILFNSSLGRRLVKSGAGQRILRFLRGGRPYTARKDASMINRDALSWLSGREGRPFFVFLNYYDAHGPYVPPEGTLPRFARESGQGDSHARVVDGYDNCIASLDDQIGRLFAELEGRGQLANTLVILTSDHGENFNEHQLYGHGKSLYRPELHVPLMVLMPGRVPPGRVVREPVSLRDLPATVASLLGPTSVSRFPGSSWARYWEPTRRGPAEGRSALAEVDRQEELPGPPPPAARDDDGGGHRGESLHPQRRRA